MPAWRCRISVSAPDGQPPPGNSASSGTKPVAMPGRVGHARSRPRQSPGMAATAASANLANGAVADGTAHAGSAALAGRRACPMATGEFAAKQEGGQSVRRNRSERVKIASRSAAVLSYWPSIAGAGLARAVDLFSRSHSNLRFASRTTFSHLRCSRPKNSANCAWVEAAGSMPCATILSRMLFKAV